MIFVTLINQTNILVLFVMVKRVSITLGLLFVLTISAFAQQYTYSPFTKVKFLNGPTDTITLTASFSQLSTNLSNLNKIILATIKQNTGKQVKGLNYSVDIKLGNYPVLSVPCSDNEMFNILNSNVGKTNRVVIKCVVYRFYYYDGICNFFYIDKINLLNSDLVTKNR